MKLPIQNTIKSNRIFKGEKYLYPHLPFFQKGSIFSSIIVWGQLVLLIVSAFHDTVFVAAALNKIGIVGERIKYLPSWFSPLLLAGLLIFILVFTMLHAGGLKAEKGEGSKRLWLGWALAISALDLMRVFNVINENICTTTPNELNPTPCANKPVTWWDALMADGGIQGLSEIALLTTFSLLTALLAYSLGKIFLNKNLNDLRMLDKKLNEDRDAINQDIKGLEALGEKPKKILEEYLYIKQETNDDMKKFRDDCFKILIDEYVKGNKDIKEKDRDKKLDNVIEESANKARKGFVKSDKNADLLGAGELPKGGIPDGSGGAGTGEGGGNYAAGVSTAGDGIGGLSADVNFPKMNLKKKHIPHHSTENESLKGEKKEKTKKLKKKKEKTLYDVNVKLFPSKNGVSKKEAKKLLLERAKALGDE